MRAVRLLALGTLLISGVTAAKDKLPPPKRDEPRPETGCEFIGPGYVKALGSDTCIKIEGSTRSDAAVFSR